MTYDDATYGDRIADVYDQWFPGEPTQAVDVLAQLAGAGRALELGIGTGRVALPLAARGVTVHGIDASEAMVARLRAKPGGDSIPVEIGSFARFDLGVRFGLVYVVFNTFFGLLTQDEQVDCFASVSRHLEPEGTFVLAAFDYDRQRHAVRDQAVSASVVDTDVVHLVAERHDPLRQLVTSSEIVVTPNGIRMFPVRLRYASHPELDLMARLAGLRLRERWAGWDGSAYEAPSPVVVSFYERAA